MVITAKFILYGAMVTLLMCKHNYYYPFNQIRKISNKEIKRESSPSSEEYAMLE